MKTVQEDTNRGQKTCMSNSERMQSDQLNPVTCLESQYIVAVWLPNIRQVVHQLNLKSDFSEKKLILRVAIKHCHDHFLLRVTFT